MRNLAWLSACFLLVALAPAQRKEEEGDEQRERAEFERISARGSTKDPAQARFTAWFESRHMPMWVDPKGMSPAWTEIGPNVIEHSWGDMENAGRTIALAIDPLDARLMYVGAASGGVWKTTDGGQHWKPIADHVASLSIGALAIDPFDHNTIYAGTGEPHYSLDSFQGAGFMRSRDAGKTWELLAADVFLGYRFTRIVPSSKRPGLLYASCTRGVFRSSDGGGSWVKLLDGSASSILVDPKDPNRLIAGIGAAFGSPLNGLYRSSDAGATWRKAAGDLPKEPRKLGRLEMTQCDAYPNVVYASFYGTSGGLTGMYRSNDFGDSWIRLPNAPSYSGDSAWYNNAIAVSPFNPNVLFASGYTTFRSLDGGQTWEDNTKSYDGGPVHPDHHFLKFSAVDPSMLYLCTDGGLFVTRNLGTSWESLSRGMGTVQFQSLDVHPWDENIAYGGTQDNGTNKYTGTNAWRNIFLGDGGVTKVNWKNPEIVYTEYVNLTICKSTNAGKDFEWNTTNGIDPAEGKLFYAPFNLDPSDPDTLVAGAQKVYRSTDAAANWKAISPILGTRVSAVVVAPSARKVIYAGTSDGRCWVTPNTGEKWYEITRGLPKGAVQDICVDPRDARVVYVALGGWTPQRIWKSVDAGGHWTSVGDDLPPMPIQCLTLNPKNPNTLFAGSFVGVFVSANADGKWQRYGKALPNVPIFSLVANAKTNWLTAGTHGRGGWRVPLPE